jgi:hypothetical protein
MKTLFSGHFLEATICAFAMLGPSVAAAQSSLVPCNLLTQAQVSAALGASVGTGEPISTTGCTWTVLRVKATLSLWDATKWETMKATLPGMAKTPVGDLGDDAFFTTGGGRKQLTTLTVKKGSTAFAFHIYGVDSVSEQMSMEKTLAQGVLAKL